MTTELIKSVCESKWTFVLERVRKAFWEVFMWAECWGVRRSYSGRGESTCQSPSYRQWWGVGWLPMMRGLTWGGEPHLEGEQVVFNPGCLLQSPEEPLRISTGASHRPREPAVLTVPLARKCRWFKWAVRLEGYFYSQWRMRKSFKGESDWSQLVLRKAW